MSIFEEIKAGLNEAIEYEKGNLKEKSKSSPTNHNLLSIIVSQTNPQLTTDFS